ncbi:hypothetical protein [Collibacillus ludicampi]|nr:hypothetical protein [Collibacillus ludicampi]
MKKLNREEIRGIFRIAAKAGLTQFMRRDPIEKEHDQKSSRSTRHRTKR